MTLDAMAKYTINDQMDVQVNVYNLTDKLYYDMMHPAVCRARCGTFCDADVELSFLEPDFRSGTQCAHPSAAWRPGVCVLAPACR